MDYDDDDDDDDGSGVEYDEESQRVSRRMYRSGRKQRRKECIKRIVAGKGVPKVWQRYEWYEDWKGSLDAKR
jgi:hypothetical protein